MKTQRPLRLFRVSDSAALFVRLVRRNDEHAKRRRFFIYQNLQSSVPGGSFKIKCFKASRTVCYIKLVKNFMKINSMNSIINTIDPIMKFFDNPLVMVFDELLFLTYTSFKSVLL